MLTETWPNLDRRREGTCARVASIQLSGLRQRLYRDSADRLEESTIIIHNESRRRVRLFRDDNLDSTFPPQDVDADIFRMAFKREVNGRVSNPEILNFDMLQERRQDRL